MRGAGGDGVHFGRKVGVLELTVETVVRGLEFLASLKQGVVVWRGCGIAPKALERFAQVHNVLIEGGNLAA